MDHLSRLTPAIRRDSILFNFKDKLGVFPACDTNAGPSARKKTLSCHEVGSQTIKGDGAVVKVRRNQKN